MLVDLEAFLNRYDIYFELYEHDPIYTNEDAVIMKEAKGFTGTETKALFLKGKSGRYYSFVTFTTKSADFKQLKKTVGEKVSIVKPAEMEEVTGQKPGAVTPLGYERSIPMIVDAELFEQEKLVFAPARPDQTMVIRAEDLEKIIRLLGNKLLIYHEE
ncbi:Ala-tRNA(Pro) deacylase [Alkalibacterium subtropicum]|uniref:Ala-tRNA(Pro) deacylase n=1 Tax=Alkalibacterium subtropicum TaxID=753702 RepID=A0A1I1JV68_9LACT|nr:YbaK/EbsC family protein [Alkalibacterium subtropicum]SFC49260.1 Ala-tRNA(Pro) deacylase [Alkalibacterium subtropicum]